MDLCKEALALYIFKPVKNRMQKKKRIFGAIPLLVVISCILIAFKSESRLAIKKMMEEPGRIGMITPSSRALYKHMIRQILPISSNTETLLVELGPGTGVGTLLLLELGLSPDQLLCVELDPELKQYMAERFPGVQTILGDAVNLQHILGDNSGKVTAIISGIPLKNLSKKQAIAIIDKCHTVLKPHGKLVQFTYSIKPPPTIPGFKRTFGGLVLFNLPPAFVWTFTKVE